MMDDMMGNMLGPWGAMGFGGGGMFLFWVLFIVGIGLFVAWLNREQGADRSGKTALDILKERYAKGEIDKNEYDTKRKDLAP